MENINLEAQIRQIGSKGLKNNYRKNGFIPAIVYGAKEKSTPLWIKGNDFLKLFHSGIAEKNILINLKIEKENKVVLIKEIQRDVVSLKPIHIDFHAISLKEKVEIEIPVYLKGDAPGVKSGGGVLQHFLREIKVRCLPKDIPQSINVDISNLNINESIRVKDLKIQKNLEILVEPNTIIVNITPVTKVEEQPQAETPLITTQEPEVISKGKKEIEEPEEKEEPKEQLNK